MLPLLTGELLEMCHCSVGFSKYSKPHKTRGFERIDLNYGHKQEGTSLEHVQHGTCANPAKYLTESCQLGSGL